MLTLSLFINLTLLIGTVIIFLYYLVSRKITQQLFIRAWTLEKKLIEIHGMTDDRAVKSEIEKTIGNIKPL